MKNFINRALVAKKHLKLFFALFAMLALGVGNAWAEESVVYTLTPAATGSNAAPHNSYAAGADFTCDEITWNITGNSYMVPWRIGGKNLNNVDRTLYSKTVMPYKVTKIEVTHGTASSVTVNSFKLIVASDANFSNVISTVDGTFEASSTATLACPNGADWSNAFYKFVYNVTIGSNNKFIQFTEAKFYGESSTTPGEGGGEDPTPDPEDPETPGTDSESSTATFTYKDLQGQGASTTGAEFTGATKENIHMSGKGNGNNSYVQIYANNYLTFTPTNATITKIVLTATSGYIKTWKASEGTIAVSGDKATWTGNSTSMVTLTNTATAQARITQMDVTYTSSSSGSGEPEPVIVKTLKSIAVTGMTTTFEQGDVFKFDGTCTATYSVTKDGAAQADETAEVTPTYVSKPDMTTIGPKEVTVTYTEGEITKTFPYNITVENALPKIVITQNEVADFTNTYAEYTWTASGVSGKIYGYKNSGMQLNSSKTGSYVYNTDPIPGYIRKIKIVKAASGTTRNWTPYVSETALTSAGGTTLDQEEVATTTTWEVTGENSYFYLLESGGATVIESITIYYEAVVPQVAAPTFTPAAGTYNAVQNVTISAEEGTTIHYTLDGTDPTTRSEVYNTPITVSETQTIKAIAVKDEKVSPIASAKYTINLPLTTMDQIFAKASDVKSTATPVEITFGNWVVSAVKEDGKTAFVTDGTKGFVIYETGCGFNVGDILSRTVACKVELYNGFAELTGLKSTTTGLSVATGGEINVVELDADGIAALTGVNTGSLIKINGICTQSGSNYYVAGVQVFSSLYAFGTLEVGAEYNITGIYQPHNTTKEMLPRSAADIEKVVGLPTATISIADITMEIGQKKTIEAAITPNAAQSTVQYAITSGNEFITLSGTTITAVAAGTATITATIAEKADEYKGATKEFTVTVKPQNIAVLPFTFNGGKADIENTLGMSQTGLDDDYGFAPKLKFNGAGDNVIVHFDNQAGEFSFLLKQNGQNAGTFTVYESANGEDYTSVWSGGDLGGNGQSATIEPTLSATARYVKFEYTTKGASTNYGLGSISIAKPDNRQDAGLAWNPTSVTLTQGEAFTAPTLNKPNSVSDITYESSNDEVATVTTAGVIALGSATGTATITATFDGDATYKPATATCTITVNEYIETIDGEWELVTDASKLQAGMEIIIASVEVDGKYYAMSKASDNGNNRTAVESTISGDKLNPAVGTSVLTLVDAGNGTFALQAGNGKYLYAASSTSNHLKEKDKIDVNGQWTITIADSKATIKAEASSNRNWIRYNNSSTMFSCYASGQKDIALYAKVPEHSRTTSAGRYGTICLPGNIVKCLGATLYEVAGKDGLRVVFDEVLTPEAGMPYIFLAHNTEVLFYCGDETAAAGNHNSLYGTFTVLQNSELEDMYMVQNNKIVKCNPANSGVAENRAYFNGSELDVLGKPGAQMPGRRRITMGTEGENEATGTEDVVAPEGQTLKLIENGQLIIIRNGEKFNAQGQKL